MLIGLQAVQLLIWPTSTSPLRIASTSEPKRSDELEKQGTFFSLASRKISMQSASEPASGLSMNSGLPASITGRAHSRCGRPSTSSRKTTSTFLSISGIVS